MSAPMGNVLETIFQMFTSPDDGIGVSLKQLMTVIQSNKLLSLKNETGIHDVLSHTHSCLRSSKNKLDGLILLGQMVHQCTTEVFQQNALTWSTLLLQILQNHCEAQIYKATCMILEQIFYFAQNFTDISREVTGSVIPQLVPMLLAAKPEVKLAAISCINSIVQTYPGPLGPFKTKIETSIVSQIDEGALHKEILQCFALLSQCGPGGSMGIKHAEAWAGQCQKVIGSLETTLGSLYEDLETDSGKTAKGRQQLPLSPIDSDHPNMVTSLVSRWTSLTACLQELLSECPQATVKLPVEDLLQLICRCLSVNSKMLLNKPTTERLVLASHLLSVHTSALAVLKQLITLCRTALIPHADVVVGLLSQELVWTATEKSGHIIQYGQLRETVYTALAVWCKVLDGNSGIHKEEKNLVKQILQDITPISHTLTLVGQAVDTKGQEQSGGKKKKHRGYQEISQGISSQRKVHQYANNSLVTAALDALYWMVLTSGTEMDKQNFQEVQSFCVKTLLNLQHTVVYPVPYSSAECRCNLYRVLHACTVSTHATVPPPTHCAYGIFRAGLQDKHLQVSSFCIEALRSCEILIHPRAPCLNGPIIIKDPIHIENNAGKLARNNIEAERHSNNAGDSQNDKRMNGEQESQMSEVSGLYEQDEHKKSDISRKRLADEVTDLGTSHGGKQAKISPQIDQVHVDINEPKPGPSVVKEISEETDEEDEDDSVNDSDSQNSDNVGTESCKRTEVKDERVEYVDEERQFSDVCDKENEKYTATKLDVNVNKQAETVLKEKDKETKDDEDGESSEHSGESNIGEVTGKSEASNKQVDDKEVDALLMTFVEAGPDSD